MRITIEPSSSTPASAQLREAIAKRITSGRLAPGERIPPVRVLADELGLAPNTVAKAYRELKAGGLVVGRGRRGTFVVEDPPGAEDGPPELDAAARAFARRARWLRVPPARALAAARRALNARVP